MPSAAGVRAQLGDLRIEASAEAEPPHRFAALRLYPLGNRDADRRVADPVTVTEGEVPARALELAAESLIELGLPGLVLAGGSWSLARGWADVATREALRVNHRFPALGITKLITSTVVLRLVASGRVELDAPVNTYLRSMRLADDEVTVLEILTHTGGVVSPTEQFAERVSEHVELGAVAGRGTFTPSNGGYAVLGQLAADVTGTPFPEAAEALVLAPLGMRDSSFPATWPDSGAIHGHHLAEDGSFEPAPRRCRSCPPWAGCGRPPPTWSSSAPAGRPCCRKNWPRTRCDRTQLGAWQAPTSASVGCATPQPGCTATRALVRASRPH